MNIKGLTKTNCGYSFVVSLTTNLCVNGVSFKGCPDKVVVCGQTHEKVKVEDGKAYYKTK